MSGFPLIRGVGAVVFVGGSFRAHTIAGAFVVRLVGSYTAVVGLPLYETHSLLSGEGFPVAAGWTDPLEPK